MMKAQRSVLSHQLFIVLPFWPEPLVLLCCFWPYVLGAVAASDRGCEPRSGLLYHSESPQSEQGCSMLPWGLGREALHGAGLAHTPALLGRCHLDRDKKGHKGQQEAFRVETWDWIGGKKEREAHISITALPQSWVTGHFHGPALSLFQPSPWMCFLIPM